MTQPQSNVTVPPKFGSKTFSMPCSPSSPAISVERDHRRAGALGDVDDVAVVVLVAVGQEDVGRLELGRLDRGLRVAGDEGVHQHGRVAGLELHGRVAQEADVHCHSIQSPCRQLSRKLVPDRDADEHAHARLLGDQRPHGGDPLVRVGDAGGAQDLGLMGGAEPVRGLEGLVEDPLQLRRGARHQALGLVQLPRVAERLQRGLELRVGVLGHGPAS